MSSTDERTFCRGFGGALHDLLWWNVHLKGVCSLSPGCTGRGRLEEELKEGYIEG